MAQPILEVAMLDVIPGEEDAFEQAFAQAQSPSLPACLAISVTSCNGVSKRRTASSYWCAGELWKTIRWASANLPSIRSGRRYCIISMIHSQLSSTITQYSKEHDYGLT